MNSLERSAPTSWALIGSVVPSVAALFGALILVRSLVKV